MGAARSLNSFEQEGTWREQGQGRGGLGNISGWGPDGMTGGGLVTNRTPNSLQRFQVDASLGYRGRLEEDVVPHFSCHLLWSETESHVTRMHERTYVFATLVFLPLYSLESTDCCFQLSRKPPCRTRTSVMAKTREHACTYACTYVTLENSLDALFIFREPLHLPQWYAACCAWERVRVCYIWSIHSMPTPPCRAWRYAVTARARYVAWTHVMPSGLPWEPSSTPPCSRCATV